MDNIYVINKTTANLIFKGGYLTIPRGGYTVAAEEDIKSSEFVRARDRGWIEVTGTKPSKAEVEPIATVDIVSPIQGMTEADLKEELAKESGDTSVPTVEALGVATTQPSEVTISSIGRDSTTEVFLDAAGDQETARKPGRKAKAAQ